MNFFEKFKYGMKSAEEIEREREKIRAAQQDMETRRQKYDREAEAGRFELNRLREQFQLERQQEIEQFEIQKAALVEREQKISNEHATIDKRWTEIRGQLTDIFNQKKSIANTWKAINDEWDKIYQHYPELKQQYLKEIAAAIDGQKHDQVDEKPIDPDVIERLHEKEFKVVAKDEIVSHIRKDHPGLHGHKKE